MEIGDRVRLTRLGLLREPESRPPRWRSARAWLSAAWAARRDRISIVFAEVLSAHLLLIVAIAITQSSPLAGRGAGPAEDRAAIRQALVRLGEEAGGAELRAGSQESREEEDALIDALGRVLKVRTDAGRDQKAEIIEYLLGSYLKLRGSSPGGADLSALTPGEIQGLLNQEGSVRLRSGEKAFLSQSADPEEGVRLDKLGKLDELQVGRMRRMEDLEKEGFWTFSDYVLVKTRYESATGTRSIPKEVYFRECPFEQILAMGGELFAAIRGFPVLDDPPAGVEKTAASDRRGTVSGQGDVLPRLNVFLIRAVSPGESPGGRAPASEAALDDARIGRILDQMMALPEGRQFAAFERDYLDRLDPNREDLARLARRFVYENLNGLFFRTDDFSLAFDSLEELYYKRPNYDAFAAYARRRPGTKAAAELLFGLADAYDFERRTLATLEAVESGAADILANRVKDTSAYNFRAKAYVLKRIAEETRARLSRLGYPTLEAALSGYRKESAAIYRLLAAMGGEIRNRALFALGAQHWDEGEVAAAVATWGEIDPGYENETYRRIKPYLGRTGEALSEAVQRIGWILEAGTEGGSADLLQRHLRFHKWARRSEALRAK